MPNKKIFIAYSDEPPTIGESVEEAVSQINESDIYTVTTWKNLSVAGHFIIEKICKGIEDSEIFICELTTLNYNVLFELGYAIACGKKVIILLDTNYPNAIKQFDAFGLLTTIGYSSYTNSQNIIDIILGYDFMDNNDLLSEMLQSVSVDNCEGILYLKSPIANDSSIKLSRYIHGVKIKTIIDDPIEVSKRTLSWYIESLFNSRGIVAHLLSSEQNNNIVHNAKVSFICGIGHGMGNPILMLAHDPFNEPIDYKNILKVHTTAKQCQKLAEDWFSLNSEDLKKEKTPLRYSAKQLKAQSELQQINMGDSVAENESQLVLDYYVQTSSYDEAIRSNHTIFVGRKGCGKTANLFKLADDFDRVQNHVCVIKPVAYEIEGILHILKQNLLKANRGFLIESLWKFLIYTELAKSIYNKLVSKPAYYELTENENNIKKYVEENENIIMPEFSARLDYAVDRLMDASNDNSISIQQQKISEQLHNKIIGQLRKLLGDYLTKLKKVIILVDNLDKAWNPHVETELVSMFIFGLLDVSSTIIKDFSKENNWRQPANISLIIFLRDDIYNQISRYALEKDKLPIKKIVWDDTEVLLRIIEERMVNGNNINIWKKYFDETVGDIPIREYIVQQVIPRPRDIIYLIKTALGNAISRKHTKIEVSDLVDAQMEYSRFAFDTLITESSGQIKDLEILLYEFARNTELMTYIDIVNIVDEYGYNEKNYDEIIKILCNLSFLGMEVDNDKFIFIYNEEDFIRYNVMAKHTAQRREDKMKRYKIHKAFHAYLGIKDNNVEISTY